MIYFKFDILNTDNLQPFSMKHSSLYELTIYIKLESVNLLIDQHTLFFILSFFKVFKEKEANKNVIIPDNNATTRKTDNNINNLNNVEIEMKKEKTKEIKSQNILEKIIIKKIIIEEFFINFCYNSHKLLLENNQNKEFLEILNLTNLKDLKILFRNYQNLNSIIFNDLFDELLVFWKDDIKNNQIINSFISSISCFKPFKNIMESFFDIFRLPYYYNMNNSNISEGAAKGFQLFFINLSSESIYLGEKVKNYFNLNFRFLIFLIIFVEKEMIGL